MTPDTPSGLTRYTFHTEPVEYKRPTVQPVFSEDDAGKWVRYSDVAALEQENRRLREALGDIARFGFVNTGLGYSCARKARAALSEKGET